jgi:predicted amidophosphoribosyltransferase
MSDERPTERRIVVERTLRLTERACARCGKRFMGWGRGKFCSQACLKLEDYYRHAEERRAKRRERHRRTKGQAKEGSDGGD